MPLYWKEFVLLPVVVHTPSYSDRKAAKLQSYETIFGLNPVPRALENYDYVRR